MGETVREIEIFSVGTWNGMKFSIEDLEEIVKNTEKLLSEKKHKPPLKLGHSTNQILKGQSDGDPAMGWIENLKIKGQKLVADFVRVPNILIRAFNEGLYRQVSVEMRHIDHTGWLLTAVSILGADLPAVKTLDDLEAFLSEKFGADKPADLETAICFSTNEPIIIEEEKTMSDNSKELEELRAELAAIKSENATFKEKEKDRTFSDKKADFLETYREDVKEGKLPPAVFKEIEKELDSQKHNFSEESELTISAGLLRTVTRAYAESLPKKETAHVEGDTRFSDVDNIDEVIENEIAKAQASGTTDYFKARDLVFRANPDLDEQYKQFTLNAHYGR